MCLIVDVNVAHRVLLIDGDPDFGPVHTALFGKTGSRGLAEGCGDGEMGKGHQTKLVYGGQLTREYQKAQKILRIVLALSRAGRARLVGDSAVEAETEVVRKTGLCTSNDAHVIALARTGKVRLLCSDDADLISDFTNKDLLNKPRGKVYRNSSHSGLIAAQCRCGKPCSARRKKLSRYR